MSAHNITGFVRTEPLRTVYVNATDLFMPLNLYETRTQTSSVLIKIKIDNLTMCPTTITLLIVINI